MTLRCPACRTRRATYLSMQKHVADSGHALCDCGGYHYAHRPFSKFCKQNPMSDVWVAYRDGASVDVAQDIAIEIAFTRPGRPIRVWSWN